GPQPGVHMPHAAEQIDVLRPSHEEAERDGLSVAVGKLLIRRIREEQLAPVSSKVGESRVACFELLGDLVPDEPTKARRGLGELFGRAGRNRSPAQEVVEELREW